MALKHLGFLNLAAVVVLGGTLVGFTSNVAVAQEGPSLGVAGHVISGKLQFRQYCAQCHGLDAKGDGPVAPALKIKPKNLTLLSQTHGGTFPEQEVVNFIDGTKFAEGHGTREMPIWGYAFRYNPAMSISGAPRSELEVKQKIDLLVAYIKTIQVK